MKIKAFMCIISAFCMLTAFTACSDKGGSSSESSKAESSAQSAAEESKKEITLPTKSSEALERQKERLSVRLGPAAEDVWASTFHSACVRILRRDIDRIGFGKDFTIYDTDDSKRVIRDILKEQNLDEKAFQPRSVLSVISASKDRYESPEDFA